MHREHDGWFRKLWVDKSGEYVTGLDVESVLRELIGAELADQHFSVETLAELLELHEGVILNSRTLRQFVNELVEEGEVVIACDGRGPGRDGRIYRSCSCLELAPLNTTDTAVELKWDRMIEDFNGTRCHSPRSIKAKKIA